MDRIVNWQNNVEMKNYIHFHGDKDMVFPFSKIHDAVEIQDGTHVMIMRRAKLISELINKNLKISDKIDKLSAVEFQIGSVWVTNNFDCFLFIKFNLPILSSRFKIVVLQGFD